MTIINEDLLDQLDALRCKRLADIATNGEPFHCNHAERSIRGLHDQQKSTVTFPAGVQFAAGSILEGKGGALYIAGTTSKAGIVVADVLPVIGEFETMTAKAGSYTKSGSVPVLSRSNVGLGVPAWLAPSIGSVIKTGGTMLKVVGLRRDGAVTLLQLASLPAEKIIEQKTAGGYRGGFDTSAPPKMTGPFGR